MHIGFKVKLFMERRGVYHVTPGGMMMEGIHIKPSRCVEIAIKMVSQVTTQSVTDQHSEVPIYKARTLMKSKANRLRVDSSPGLASSLE